MSIPIGSLIEITVKFDDQMINVIAMIIDIDDDEVEPPLYKILVNEMHIWVYLDKLEWKYINQT